jgi:hypothetical protein
VFISIFFIVHLTHIPVRPASQQSLISKQNEEQRSYFILISSVFGFVFVFRQPWVQE